MSPFAARDTQGYPKINNGRKCLCGQPWDATNNCHGGHPKVVACKFCGRGTSMLGTGQCDNCYEVSSRLQGFLASEKGRAYALELLGDNAPSGGWGWVSAPVTLKDGSGVLLVIRASACWGSSPRAATPRGDPNAIHKIGSLAEMNPAEPNRPWVDAYPVIFRGGKLYLWRERPTQDGPATNELLTAAEFLDRVARVDASHVLVCGALWEGYHRYREGDPAALIEGWER